MSRELFNKIVYNEFAIFKKNIMEKGIEYVFNNAYEINCIMSLRDYLTEREDEFVEGLYPYANGILNELSLYESGYDVPMYANWDNIEIMIKDFICEKQKKEGDKNEL